MNAKSELRMAEAFGMAVQVAVELAALRRVAEAARTVIDYASAPPICDTCRDPEHGDLYGECVCEMMPTCHVTRMDEMERRRAVLLEALAVLDANQAQPGGEGHDAN